MIEVKVTYSKKTFKSGREVFHYKDILIKGHSSDGTINSIKCCAGVTAITCGLLNLLEATKCEVEVNKGYFHYKAHIGVEDEVNYAMNCLIYQIDSISMIYPSFFKEFEFIEEKNQNGEN